MMKKFFKTRLLHNRYTPHLLAYIESPVYYYSVVLYILFCFSLFIVSRELPGGLRFLTAQSNSMSPAISQGDLMLVKHVAGGYDKGDIASFYSQRPNGEEEIVTHRIFAVSGNVYLTKGDHNEAIDEQKLRPRFTIGKVVAVIPNTGYIITFLKSQLGQLVCVILPGALFISLEIFRLSIYLHQGRKTI